MCSYMKEEKPIFLHTPASKPLWPHGQIDFRIGVHVFLGVHIWNKYMCGEPEMPNVIKRKIYEICLVFCCVFLVLFLFAVFLFDILANTWIQNQETARTRAGSNTWVNSPSAAFVKMQLSLMTDIGLIIPCDCILHVI